MSEYAKELLKQFVMLLHDPILKNELNPRDKRRFNWFKHRISKKKRISEQAMRETVETFGKKKIQIVSIDEHTNSKNESK